jgi:putative membrane-bound dehydrogenase-like protein
MLPRYSYLVVSFMGLLSIAAAVAWSQAPAQQPEKDYSAELPRIAPKEPAEALKTFTVKPGFRIEQAATEPLVNDPVAMAFDENGRLFVVEMRDYSEQDKESLGVIRLLVDTDEDGKFDQSTIYADQLSWPTAVACWDGGVFVGAAPDIFYFKDTDGDGKADVRKTVFTGFGRSNVQGLMNTFTWTLDNRIQGATSSSGGDIRRADEPQAKPIVARGRDFQFDPRTLRVELTSGGAQHGLSFDIWGRKFVCSNSDHIQQVMFEDRYVARNPYLTAPSARVSIAADGPQAEVYRTSPVEPWRIVRTRLRVSGEVKGAVEGGGRAAGYFTGATGVTIYRGNAFPEDLQGMAIVADIGSNLVHRKRLALDGLQFVASRMDKESEFVSSNDIWFRPAQFANAPDGTLYIADVYREVIEHPASIPPMIKKHLDLTSGRDRGRIYRIVPDGFQQPKLPKLGKATTEELVATLAHPNSWHRETASRLLYERQDKAAVEPLVKLAAESPSPLGRMHALYALDGLQALDSNIVSHGLRDSHPRVREHAIRLSERVGDKSKLSDRFFALASDSDMEVRYQLAFTLGNFPGAGPLEVLKQLAKRDGENKWMRLAILSSLADGAGPFFADLVSDSSFRQTPGGREMLLALATQIGLQDRQADVAVLFKGMAELPDSESALTSAIVRGLSAGLAKRGRPLKDVLAADSAGKAAKILQNLLVNAQKAAADEKLSAKVRTDAINTLVLGSFADVKNLFAQLLDQRQDHEVQQAALGALDRINDPAVAPLVLEKWPTLSPRLRVLAAEALFARKDRIVKLLDAIEKKEFQPTDLESPRVQLLLAYNDPQIRERAKKLLGDVKLGRRQDVVEAYRSVLKLSGDAARGKVAFQKVCAACHRAENVGHESGPNLASMKARGAEAILLNLLDPSREVNPQFVNYVLLTDDGRTLTGMIAAETATSVTLKRAEGATDTVLRINIEELRSTGLSLMPEGMEKQLDQQTMADLIAYIMTLK